MNSLYVLATHWDREYYATTAQFSYRFSAILDKIMTGQESGKLDAPFVLDGQVLPIQDYLELRPERTETVLNHLKNGDIVVGPWYVMPDLMLVSGESIIRNIEAGTRLSHKLGAKPSKILHCCDCFGFPGQLPQIASMLGIDGITVWRGTNKEDSRQLIWTGIDGTEAVCHRFGRASYWGYAVHVRNCTKYGRSISKEELTKNLNEHIAYERERTAENTPVLLFDGIDHAGWDEDAYSKLPKDLQKGSLDDFFKLIDRTNVTCHVSGELHEEGIEIEGVSAQATLKGTLSSRVNFKQRSSICERNLLRIAEPLAALTYVATGHAIPESIINRSWEWLLQNHFHDAICGSSSDQAHRSMTSRFRQSHELSDCIKDECIKLLCNDTSEKPRITDQDLYLSLINTYDHPANDVVCTEINVPDEWNIKSKEDIPEKDFLNVPYQILNVSTGHVAYRTSEVFAPEIFNETKVQLAIDCSIPAYGRRTLKLIKPESINKKATQTLPKQPILDNGILRVEVAHDGSLNITDLRNGRITKNGLVFVDEADSGTCFHCELLENSKKILSTEFPFSCEQISDGLLHKSLKITHYMMLPEMLSNDRKSRTKKTVLYTITSEIALKSESNTIEIKTNLQNNVKDHRLRVMFDTQIKENTYRTDSAFSIVKRPVHIEHPKDAVEPAVDTFSQLSLTSYETDKGGLTLVADGIRETTVRETNNRPIALTLLRGTDVYKFVDKNSDNQCIGNHEFKMYLTVTDQKPSDADLLRLSDMLLTPPLAHVHTEGKEEVVSFITPIENDKNSVLTSIRKQGDNILETRLNTKTWKITTENITKLN